MPSRRHRPTEPYAPRPSDLIADRFRALAAFARKRDAFAHVDGVRVDAKMLEVIAREQATLEAELTRCFGTLKRMHADFDEVRVGNNRLLDEAIRAFSEIHHDPEAKRVLRLCRLRRPPLAKVHALVAPHRADLDQPSPTHTRMSG